jgi:hypothetical protein
MRLQEEWSISMRLEVPQLKPIFWEFLYKENPGLNTGGQESQLFVIF